MPDLAQLSTVSPLFRKLASDKALHRLRVLVVAPSRIRHFLFAQGGNLRPTVGDLVQRGVMRGLGLERRWRDGLYFYSPQVNKFACCRSDIHLSIWALLVGETILDLSAPRSCLCLPINIFPSWFSSMRPFKGPPHCSSCFARRRVLLITYFTHTSAGRPSAEMALTTRSDC